MISYISISLLLLFSCLQQYNCFSLHRSRDHYPDQPLFASDSHHQTHVLSESEQSESLNFENRETFDLNAKIESIAHALMHTPVIPVATKDTDDLAEDLMQSNKNEQRKFDGSGATYHEYKVEEPRFGIENLIDAPSMDRSNTLIDKQPASERLGKSSSHMIDSGISLGDTKNIQRYSNKATQLNKPFLFPLSLPNRLTSMQKVNVSSYMMNENVSFKQGKIRHRRSPRHIAPNYNTPSGDQDNPLLSPACESVTQWIQLDEAEDFEGNMVLVLDHVEPGVKQFFLETTCKRSRPARYRQSTAARRSQLTDGSQDGLGRCAGVDHTNYESICHEGHGYTYAKVIDPTLLTGSRAEWRLIKIRTSCSCSVAKRHGHRLSY